MTHSFRRSYLRFLTPGLLLWLVFILALATGRADASAPKPASGSCTTGTSPHGHELFRCFNRTYHCDKDTPDHAQINVVVRDAPKKVDAVHVDDGCSNKSIRVRIETDSGDGIKLHDGAEHLRIWFGKPQHAYPFKVPHDASFEGKVGILCSGKHGDVHQDGIQAMGGRDIQIMAPNIRCPSGNNGGLFCNNEAGHPPTDVVAIGGFIYERNSSIHQGPGSVRCGGRGVVEKTDRTDASPPNCMRTDHAATDPVDEDNFCTTRK